MNLRAKVQLVLLVTANAAVLSCLLWPAGQSWLDLRAAAAGGSDGPRPGAAIAGPRAGSRAGEAALARAESGLPDRSRLPALSEDLRGIARSAGARLARIDYRILQEGPGPYDFLELTVVAHGSYRALKLLVWGLEAAGVRLALHSLQVAGPEDSGGGPSGVVLTARTCLLPARAPGGGRP